MDLIDIRCSETKTLPFSDMNTVNTDLNLNVHDWWFLAKHCSYEIPKGQFSNHWRQSQKGRVLKVYGQYFYQQDFRKNSILETESMGQSAAMVQFTRGHSLLTLWHHFRTVTG